MKKADIPADHIRDQTTDHALPPLEDLPETQLVTLARRKDEGAVRELIRRCNQQLFRTARAIVHNDAEAEDVVQAAYVAAFTGLDRFRGESAFITWITRITLNESYGRLRRQARIVDLAEFRNSTPPRFPQEHTPMTLPPQNAPETETARKEIRHFLEQAIDALPEPFRLTYVLRDIEDRPTREVAQLLGIKPVTVKTRLFRARRLLRAELHKTVATEFSAVFPFDGARCVNMADRVIRALQDP